MSNIFDLTYLGLILILSCLSVIFFIAQKRENASFRLKYPLVILFGVCLSLFVIRSLSSLILSLRLSYVSESGIIGILSFFFLCFYFNHYPAISSIPEVNPSIPATPASFSNFLCCSKSLDSGEGVSAI